MKAAKEAMPPPPDPREASFFDTMAAVERSALARMVPRRWLPGWTELEEIDTRLAANAIDQQRMLDSLTSAQQELNGADPEHEQKLAQWFAGGKRGLRPPNRRPELKEQIAALQHESPALQMVRDKLFEERVRFVQKHRRRLVKDAERAKHKARNRIVAALAELAQARQELVECQQSAIWAALYPHDSLATMAPTLELVGGMKRVTLEALPGANQGAPAEGDYKLLRADADYQATLATVEQAAAIQGTMKGALSEREAGSAHPRGRVRARTQGEGAGAAAVPRGVGPRPTGVP